MQAFHTTAPDRANPFADTADDPREVQRQVSAVLARAHKRRAAVPEPRTYWEEPGLHGHKREVSLRRPVMQSAVKRRPTRREASYSTGKLPAMPQRHLSGVELALIGGAVLGVGAFGYWLWQRGRRGKVSSHVGSGFDLLGVEA